MSPTAANRTPPSSDELFSPSLIDQSVQDSLPPNHTLRPLNRNDYHKGYLENLKSLTWVGDVSHTQFLEHFDWMKSRDGWFYNVVVEHEGRIVGNGVLIVERKLYAPDHHHQRRVKRSLTANGGIVVSGA